MTQFICPKTSRKLIVNKDELLYEDGTFAYKIINNIPCFVEINNYADAFGLQWNSFPKTQLDSFTNTNISENRLKLSFGNDLTILKGKKILEAGSGAGRFTEILLKYGAEVYSFDFSKAVEANYFNNNQEMLTVFQADIREIPFPENSFDYVLCIGVLQHTPNTWESIRSLFKTLKKGGELVIDHYTPQVGIYLSLYLVYRYFIKKLSPNKQLKITNKLTSIWFPIHWKFRKYKIIQSLLHRITPINFYYGEFPLSKELHYEWSRLDTHDRNTDHYKRHIRISKIGDFLEKIGGHEITAGTRRPGVASCVK